AAAAVPGRHGRGRGRRRRGRGPGERRAGRRKVGRPAPGRAHRPVPDEHAPRRGPDPDGRPARRGGNVIEDVGARIQRVRDAMDQAQLDGILAFAPGWRRENVRYLTGAALRGAFAFGYLPARGPAAAFVGNVADEHAVRQAGWVPAARG